MRRKYGGLFYPITCYEGQEGEIRFVVNAMLQLLYPQERYLIPTVQEAV
jgi:hypothetical protein